MNTKVRKILFLFFILAFLIITPLISFYAAGYKISFSGRILQKTGMLVLDSSPSGAKIFIDGEAQQKFFNSLESKILNTTKEQNILKTPAKIKGLVPGEYTVRLEKDGYWPWEKKLLIIPGNSTFAEDIVMFKNNLPQPVINKEILNAELSPNSKYFAIITDNQYVLLNIENDDMLYFDRNIENTLNPDNSIAWLENGLVLIEKNLFYIDDWQNPTDLKSSLQNIDPSTIKSSGSGSLYLTKNNNIIKLDLKSGRIETILNSDKILDFTIKDNLIYTLEEINDSIYFIVYDNKKIIRQISLNADDTYIFLKSDKNNLSNIYSQKFKTLYIVDPFDYYAPLKETINNVNMSFWVDTNRLVYYNDFEIWTYDVSNFKKTILTRMSSKINFVIWHPSNNYIIFSTSDALYTIELDNREKHNSNQLLKLKNINYLHINNTGDSLYFYSQVGRQNMFLKLSI